MIFESNNIIKIKVNNIGYVIKIITCSGFCINIIASIFAHLVLTKRLIMYSIFFYFIKHWSKQKDNTNYEKIKMDSNNELTKILTRYYYLFVSSYYLGNMSFFFLSVLYGVIENTQIIILIIIRLLITSVQNIIIHFTIVCLC